MCIVHVLLLYVYMYMYISSVISLVISSCRTQLKLDPYNVDLAQTQGTMTDTILFVFVFFFVFCLILICFFAYD